MFDCEGCKQLKEDLRRAENEIIAFEKEIRYLEERIEKLENEIYYGGNY